MANTIDELFIEFVFLFENSELLPKALKKQLGLKNELWELIHDCNITLLKLLKRKVMKEKEVADVVEEFDFRVSVLCSYIDKKSQIRLAMYWLSAVRTMNERCLEEEQFEACSNIKKFSDLYFLTALENDNE